MFLAVADASGRSLAGNAGLNPAGGNGYLSCVLSGRGLCVGLITCPEDSYRLKRV